VTPEQRQALRVAALRTARERYEPSEEPGLWKLQTSNSYRRIGTVRGDGDVLCATIHPIDRHPDLLAPPGVLDYIVAAQPRVVLELLDQLDKLEREAAAVVIDNKRESADHHAELEALRLVVDAARLNASVDCQICEHNMNLPGYERHLDTCQQELADDRLCQALDVLDRLTKAPR
jgi:hypothetical protein